MNDREDAIAEVGGRIVVGGVPVADLATTFGTPCYVFDAAVVGAAVQSLFRAFRYRPLRVFYSVKAHANVALLQLLRRLEVSADCGSPGDLAFAVAAGFGPMEISYCGHGLTEGELDEVACSGATFVAGSISQLDGYLRRRPGANVALRVNCGIEAGFHPTVQAGTATAKFGVQGDELAEAAELARARRGRIVGLHGHLGSDIAEPDPYLELVDALLRLSTRHGLDLDFIDLGGGFGVPFTAKEAPFDMDALGAGVDLLLETHNRRRRQPLEVRLEPGSYLIREAGYLLTRVTEVIDPVGAQPGMISVDSSVNHLPGALYFGAAHPLRISSPAPGPPGMFTIAGNLMLAGDVLRRGVTLRRPVVGDVAVFGLCGAYTATRASTFNQRPRPAEVLVENGGARLIRRPEGVPDLLSGQVGLADRDAPH